MRDGGLQAQGEDFCWHANYYLGSFLRAYQAWNDTAWLDQGVRYYEFLCSKLLTGPDGYQGWIGPYEYDHSVWCDVHVGDAVLCNGMTAFAEVVLADRQLRSRYGAEAEKYVALARKHLFEKWDARGTWREDGPYGAYRSWNRYGDAGNLKDWPVRETVSGTGLALPFNKQDDVAAVALKLYRITGEKQFRERAARIFAYQKSRFGLVDASSPQMRDSPSPAAIACDSATQRIAGCPAVSGYVWNYWEPFAQEDLDLAAHKCRHWVGVHPERNYQEGEVRHMVEAYDTGVVFDQEDMRRLVNTNLKIMWNGSLEEPKFRNSNATLPWANPKQTAGTLWSALDDFDDTVRQLHAARLSKARGGEQAIEKAYFENVTLRRPANFERRLLKGAPAVFDFPMASCTGFLMAAALPSTFSSKEGTILACEAPVKGAIEIAQYSADGKRKLATLHQADQQWFLFHRWSGIAPGTYRVRWTFEGGGYREAPVVCKP